MSCSFRLLASTIRARGSRTPRPRSLSWADQFPIFERELGGLVARADTELAEDRGDVVADGFLGDDEARGNLRVREALGDELEHVELALRQAGRMLARSRARAAGDPARAALAEAP